MSKSDITIYVNVYKRLLHPLKAKKALRAIIRKAFYIFINR